MYGLLLGGKSSSGRAADRIRFDGESADTKIKIEERKINRKGFSTKAGSPSFIYLPCVGTIPFLLLLVFARDKRTVTTCSFALYSSSHTSGITVYSRSNSQTSPIPSLSPTRILYIIFPFDFPPSTTFLFSVSIFIFCFYLKTKYEIQCDIVPQVLYEHILHYSLYNGRIGPITRHFPRHYHILVFQRI